jgi:hypothetical protein
MSRYFEEYITQIEGDSWPKCLGVKVLEDNTDNRQLGYYGRKEFTITVPITLNKGPRTVTYNASAAKPIKVFTMLQKIDVPECSEGKVVLKPGDVVKSGLDTLLVEEILAGEARTRLLGELQTTRIIPQEAELTDVVDHRGEAWLNDYLVAHAIRQPGQSTKPIAEKEQTMAKKKQVNLSPGNSPRAAGKCGAVMGYSICAVLKRLGMDGVTTEHGIAIMGALRVPVNPTTVKLNLRYGAKGDRNVAPLTLAQVKELRSAAPEPVQEAPETTKAKPVASGKAKRSPRKRKPVTEPAAEQAVAA